VPDLDLIDTLYDRMLNGQPTTDLAAPAVVKALQATIEAVRKEAAADGDPPTLGMLWDWQATAEGQRTKLSIWTDAAGSRLFTIDTVDGKRRVSAADDRGGSE
jgi:hypothetical protein